MKDLSLGEFKSLLHKTLEIIADLYTDIGQKQVHHTSTYEQLHEEFGESLPQNPLDVNILLEKIKTAIIPNVTLHYSPHFYAWVTSNASQASLIGEMIASALNVNATTWLNAPAASEMEQTVIQWIGQFIQYDPDAAGVLLSGGSMANFTGLKLAIKQKAPYPIENEGFDRDRPLIFYVSEQNHFCIDRAIMALGVGANNLRKIKTNEDFTIDTAALESQIKTDLEKGYYPICVIANAGTVNTGTVDPISELTVICKDYKLWLHLDAAYGGFAAATNLRNSQFKGLELVDSIAIDLHKWLFVPFECSCLLVKSAQQLKDSFSLIPEYQKFEHEKYKVDFSEYSMQQSRNFKALKVWMNFKAYGARQLKAAIQKSMNLMTSLAGLIKVSDDFELMVSPSLSVVCFRYAPKHFNGNTAQLNQLNQHIANSIVKEGKVFIQPTTLRHVVVLRACCTNFRREEKHLPVLLQEIRRIGEKIQKTAL